MPSADPSKLKVVKEIQRPDILFSLARARDSSRLWLGSSDAKVYELDLAAEKPEPQALSGHTSYVTGLAWAGSAVVSGAWEGRLIWWNAATREQLRAVDAHQRWIRRVIASPDGSRVASVADDMVCRIWIAETGALERELRGHELTTPHHYPSMLYACAYSPDGQLLATGDKAGHVVVWETASGNQATTLEAPGMYTWDPQQRRHSIGGIRSLAFSPDGNLLAVGGMGQVGNIDHLEGKARIEIFDWRKRERLHEIQGDQAKGLVEQLAFHHQGDWLLAAGGDHGGFLIFFDLKAGKVLKEDKAPMHIHGLALAESSEAIFAAGHNRVVLWELKGEE